MRKIHIKLRISVYYIEIEATIICIEIVKMLVFQAVNYNGA
jgi:hypothetical protein